MPPILVTNPTLNGTMLIVLPLLLLDSTDSLNVSCESVWYSR